MPPNGGFFIAMEVLQLRQTLEALFADILGIYKLPNGQERAAMYVVGEHGVPKGWKASGLEVTIRQFPRQASRPLMGAVQINQTWEVKLVNYTPSSSVLQEAIKRLLRHFPDARANYMEYSDIAYEQYRVLIPDVETTLQYMRAE
jgi:hypothetical protein